MMPVAPLHEVLLIHKGGKVAHTHAESIYSNSRKNPRQLVTLSKGLLKCRLSFDKEGTLELWERYTYKNMMGETRGNTPKLYHSIQILEGTYSPQIVNAFMKGIKVEKPVDTETPKSIY